jgi:hypothetical protein
VVPSTVGVQTRVIYCVNNYSKIREKYFLTGKLDAQNHVNGSIEIQLQVVPLEEMLAAVNYR